MGALALVVEKPADKPTPTPFGVWIKEHRTAKGLTQEELGTAAGCTGAFVSGLERGADRSKPAPEIVDAWARALDVPPNEARRVAGHPPILTTQAESERVILDYYEAASEPSREIMRAVLKTIYEVDQKRVAEEAAKQSEDQEQGSSAKKASKWPVGKQNATSKKAKG